MKITTGSEEISRTNPLNISIFEEQKLKFPFHYHVNEYELTLTIGSSGIRLTGDHIGDFGNTDLVFTGPGLPHCWLNALPDTGNSQETIMVVVLHFNRHLFTEELLGRNELEPVKLLLNNAQRGVCFRNGIREEIRDKILELTIEQDFGTLIEIFSIFARLSTTPDFDILCSNTYRFSGKKDEPHKFENVFGYILRNFREKIRIADAAALAEMNESAFSHYFKKRTGKSYTDFVNELRLHYAAHKLTGTNANIADISLESGFNNLSNFNRIFKSWKKITPRQWRKRTQPVIY